MSKLLKVTLAMTFAVVLLGAYRPVAAQMPSSHGNTPAPTFSAVSPDTAIPDAVAKPHVLKGTYIHSGLANGRTDVTGGTYTPIDTKITVKCPVGPCLISAAMLVQATGNTSSSNLTRVCLYVDGVPGPSCAYFAAETTIDGEFTNSVQFDLVGGLATGDHTVQMYFQSGNDGAYAHYQVTYSLYQP
jgi:hypothetical protein